MVKISLDSENLVVDWVSFNLQDLVDSRIIAGRLSKYFIKHVLVNGVPEIAFHGLRKRYKVLIHQSTGLKGSWVGTKIIFSGESASYFYKLLKTGKFDWSLLKFEGNTLSLG